MTYNPLYPFIFKYVPFFNGIRYPAKFLYIFILILSITAGLGFQRLVEFSKREEEKRINEYSHDFFSHQWSSPLNSGLWP